MGSFVPGAMQANYGLFPTEKKKKRIIAGGDICTGNLNFWKGFTKNH